MPIQLDLEIQAIRSYKRLSYTAWHALAEFVDNSTQSFLNNRATLDAAYAESNEKLEVSIVFDRDQEFLRIADNSIGMTYDELEYALRIGARPSITSGRSKYGLGMKTAACWFGNFWTVRTKKLGESEEITVEVDVERVANGERNLPLQRKNVSDTSLHYTVLEISELNQKPKGRTAGKIKDFLRSMYRQDLRRGTLRLLWQNDELQWDDTVFDFLKSKLGMAYKKDFNFSVNSKSVIGWVGVLDRGGRPKAGFSILHNDRVIRGWPDSWRPESIFGQLQGTNDLINQRITGEIHLDQFEVSHTKDDIVWDGSEEDEVQDELKKVCADFVAVARARRKSGQDERGPTEIEIQTAVAEFQDELSSDELVDILSVDPVPPELVEQAVKPLRDSIEYRDPNFGGPVGKVLVDGYLVGDLSPNDPYVVLDYTDEKKIVVIVNLNHPYIQELSGSEGFLNYLRQCTFDAMAEWQARYRASTMDPDTIKLLKDQLLRLPSRIEVHEAGEATPV